MRYFYPKHHLRHHPTIDLSDGLPGFTHLEVPDRVETVLDGFMEAWNAPVIPVETLAKSAELAMIHDGDYIQFLFAIVKELDEGSEYIPPIFRKDLSASPLFFRGGMYCDEIGTPIGIHTVDAARNSVATALEAADFLLGSGEDAAALTRPPGHHAGRRRYGGYCFFNNAYLAARLFENAGRKVAVTDIDYHIGDGSLEFARASSPYFSLHADIHRNYPYLEPDFHIGNPVVTLRTFQTGIDGDRFAREVKALLDSAIRSDPDILILSLGFDTLGTDYCQDEYIYVSPKHFEKIGRDFAEPGIPTLILLEGGYDSDNLKKAAYFFMKGFRSGR